MPRPTKEETKQALTAFASEVLPLIYERLNDDVEKVEQSFEHNGWYYLNFNKRCWADGFIEISVERLNMIEGKPLLRKKGQIRERCWIYREGENIHLQGKHKGKDTGFILNGYSFQDYLKRSA